MVIHKSVYQCWLLQSVELYTWMMLRLNITGYYFKLYKVFLCMVWWVLRHFSQRPFSLGYFDHRGVEFWIFFTSPQTSRTSFSTCLQLKEAILIGDKTKDGVKFSKQAILILPDLLLLSLHNAWSDADLIDHYHMYWDSIISSFYDNKDSKRSLFEILEIQILKISHCSRF